VAFKHSGSQSFLTQRPVKQQAVAFGFRGQTLYPSCTVQYK